MTPLISIVIPHYNGKDILLSCLESLKKIQYKNVKVIVSDDGSTDDSLSTVKVVFPDIIVLTNKINTGFAATCNRGIKHALELGADYVMLLNNDTVVASDFLDKMMPAFTDNRCGIAGAKIYYFKKKNLIWYAGGDFIKWRASGKHRFWQKADNKELVGIKDTGFVTGCAMLIKREVLKKIGLFYEPFFLTVEDLDFCSRAREAGYKNRVALNAKIWHKVSFSRAGEFSFSNGYYGTRNRLIFAFKRTKNYTGGLILLFLILPVRTIMWVAQGKFKMLKGMILGVVDFFLGREGERIK